MCGETNDVERENQMLEWVGVSLLAVGGSPPAGSLFPSGLRGTQSLQLLMLVGSRFTAAYGEPGSERGRVRGPRTPVYIPLISQMKVRTRWEEGFPAGEGRAEGRTNADTSLGAVFAVPMGERLPRSHFSWFCLLAGCSS